MDVFVLKISSLRSFYYLRVKDLSDAGSIWFELSKTGFFKLHGFLLFHDSDDDFLKLKALSIYYDSLDDFLAKKRD